MSARHGRRSRRENWHLGPGWSRRRAAVGDSSAGLDQSVPIARRRRSCRAASTVEVFNHDGPPGHPLTLGGANRLCPSRQPGRTSMLLRQRSVVRLLLAIAPVHRMCRPQHVLDGPLDPLAECVIGVEMPRRQDGPNQRGDVVVALAKRLAQRLEQGVGWHSDSR